MPEGPLLCRVVRGFLLLESVGVRLCFRPHGLLSFPEEETSVIWEPSQLLFCGGAGRERPEDGVQLSPVRVSEPQVPVGEMAAWVGGLQN